jgi:hypothetical protein
VYSITATTLRQRLVPTQLCGRIHAGSRVLALLGLAPGGLVGGWFAAIANLTVPVRIRGCAFPIATIALTLDRPDNWPATDHVAAQELA